MKITLKFTLASLGSVLLAAFALSSCGSTVGSFDGTHTMTGPQNTTYTMPDESMR